MAEPILTVDHLVKSYDGKTNVLDNVSFAVKPGEVIVVVGPSGCGKTTTLRIIGGFEQPDSGDVFFDGKRLNDVPPYQREINTVFQRYALFPHLNVAENIGYGLKLKKVPKSEIRKKVSQMLELVQLEGYEKSPVQRAERDQRSHCPAGEQRILY